MIVFISFLSHKLWPNAEFNSASFKLNHVFLKWPEGGQKQHLSLEILDIWKTKIQNTNIKTLTTFYRKKLLA